jgi:hypothetical protein
VYEETISGITFSRTTCPLKHCLLMTASRKRKMAAAEVGVVAAVGVAVEAAVVSEAAADHPVGVAEDVVVPEAVGAVEAVNLLWAFFCCTNTLRYTNEYT